MKLEEQIQAQLNSMARLSKEQRENLIHKLESIAWIREKITPINTVQSNQKHKKGRKSNCTNVALKCARVLAGLEKPDLVPAKKKNLNMTWGENEYGRITYTEIINEDQAELIQPQDFIETIDLISNDNTTAHIDLIQTNSKNSVKYITTSHNSIIEDISSMAGTAESQGEDKTLVGLIFYYYKNYGGHLANFFRDRFGNLFFVDAQSNVISEIPPEKIQKYMTREEVFFFAVPPKGGYFIKHELSPIKIEAPFADSRETDTLMTVSDLTFCGVLGSIEHNQVKKNSQTSSKDMMDLIMPKPRTKQINADNIVIESCSDDEYSDNEVKEKSFFLSSHRYNRIVDKQFEFDHERKMYYTTSDVKDIRYDTARLNKKVCDFNWNGTFVFESTDNGKIYLKPIRKNLGAIKCYEKWKSEIAKIKEMEEESKETANSYSDISDSEVEKYANLSKNQCFSFGRARKSTGGKVPKRLKEECDEFDLKYVSKKIRYK